MSDHPTTTPQAQAVRLLYPYDEARELLGGVSRATWFRWIRIGLFTPVAVGPRRRFIHRDDLNRLAARQLPKAV